MALRVLIVEPDRLQREAMRLYLSGMLDGSAVTAAETSDDALRHARTSGADIVITALRLDPLSGLDLIRQLHSDCPTCPVIVHTAYDAMRGSAIEAGATQCVPKGSLSQLMQAVQAALDPPHTACRAALRSSEQRSGRPPAP